MTGVLIYSKPEFRSLQIVPFAYEFHKTQRRDAAFSKINATTTTTTTPNGQASYFTLTQPGLALRDQQAIDRVSSVGIVTGPRAGR
jgi:hypothetical protein